MHLSGWSGALEFTLFIKKWKNRLIFREAKSGQGLLARNIVVMKAMHSITIVWMIV